jgi:CHAT domain-containing protein
LVNLFKLGVFSNDESSIKKYSERLRKFKKKSLYDQHWDNGLVGTLLSTKNIDASQIKSVITQLSKNELLSSNVEVYIKISQYFLDKGFLQEAVQYKEKALSILPSSEINPSVNAQFYLLSAGLDLNACNYDQMNSLIMKSKDLLLSRQNDTAMGIIQGSRKEYLSLLQKAVWLYTEAYKESKDTALVLQCAGLTDEAIGILYTLRLGLIGAEDRIVLMTQLTQLCDRALNNYFELSRIQPLSSRQMNNLLNYLDANKSFNLRINRKLKNSLTFVQKLRFSSIEAELEDIKRALDSSVVPSPVNLDKKDILIDSLQNIYENVVQSGNFDPFINITQVQNKLQENQSIIEYFNSSENIYALAINKNATFFERLPIQSGKNALSINELLVTLGNSITDGYKLASIPFKEFSQTSYKIYELLIKPIISHLNKNVVIVPEANMSNLPWAALLTEPTSTQACKSWPYWIRTNTIATQHSLSLWIDEDDQIEHKEIKSKITLAAFAPHFDNLDYNKEECVSLNKQMGGNIFLADSASRNNFLAYSKQSEIIHISSHAKASPDEADSSYIILANDTLYNDEIERNSMSANLVFLSACETGIGLIVRSEGVMSLARSFFTAGAKAVISTLWKVNDKRTSAQIKKVYYYLKQGQSKDEAIRSMQLDYLANVAKNSEQAYPFYWAAYQCQGELKPLYKNSSLNTSTLMTFLPMIFFIIIGIAAYLFPIIFLKKPTI